MVTVCWFCPFWRYFNLVKQVLSGVSGHLLENAWREWLEILHADVSWPPSELIRLWTRSVHFSLFGAIFTQWNGSNLGCPGICWRTHGGNGLKFCMLMYPDLLQNWLDCGPTLFIFLFLVLFSLSETGQIWGFQAFAGERMEAMARSVHFSIFCCYFDLVKWVKLGVHCLSIFLPLALFLLGCRTHKANGLKFCMLMEAMDYMYWNKTLENFRSHSFDVQLVATIRLVAPRGSNEGPSSLLLCSDANRSVFFEQVLYWKNFLVLFWQVKFEVSKHSREKSSSWGSGGISERGRSRLSSSYIKCISWYQAFHGPWTVGTGENND